MPTASARTFIAIISIIGCVQTTFAADGLPRAIDSRLKIELFAEHPDIVTPTGIDIDPAGRVWAIESNTHFPPAGYKGHPSDRILGMQDTNGDHKADKITLFTDGLNHTMSIAVKPIWLKSQEARDKSQKNKAAGPRPGGTTLDVFIATTVTSRQTRKHASFNSTPKAIIRTTGWPGSRSMPWVGYISASAKIWGPTTKSSAAMA